MTRDMTRVLCRGRSPLAVRVTVRVRVRLLLP